MYKSRRIIILTIFFVYIILIHIAPLSLYSMNEPPEKPDIYLPSVVLKIEDLSVKNIVAPLPEEVVAAPDINFPLPGKEDLEISEAGISGEPFPSVMETKIAEKSGKLKTTTIFGIGTLNNFYSYISLYSFATKPEARLIYEHETADGFSGKPSSIGYSFRSDDVNASANYNEPGFKIIGDSSFNEIETGLQQNSNYYSKINRFINFNAEVSYKISDKIKIKGNLKNNFDSQRLTGGNLPYAVSREYSFFTNMNAEYNFNKGEAGIVGDLGYRDTNRNKRLKLTKVSLGSYIYYELSDKNSIKAGVNGYWNSDGDRYIPFYIGIQSNINDFVSISTDAGYRVKYYNLYDIYRSYNLIDMPATLKDGTDWYFNGGIMWIATNNWAFTSKIEVSKYWNLPGFDKTLNQNGLFNLEQYSGSMLTTNIGARWIINENISSRIKLSARIGKIPPNMNNIEAGININGITQKGNLGGSTELLYLLNKINQNQLPELNIRGFYKINEYFNFSIEIHDILQPIFKITRYSEYPYIDKGFFATIKTSVNF